MLSSLQIKRILAEFVLSHGNPARLRRLSEIKAIRAFKRLIKLSPRYREILDTARIDIASVKNIADFHRVIPFLTKKQLYASNSSARLFNANNISPASITASSGHGGQYGFAPVSRRQAARNSALVDLGLALHFHTDRLKTLIINCLPMGVSICSGNNTVVNVSVREDTAIAAAETFAAHYDQLIFLCDPLFGKHLADQAHASTLDWSRHRVHVLCGGETCGENFRRYLAHCFQIDLSNPATGSVRASMGMGEIGLNLMFETPMTIALRNKATQDRRLHRDLFGAEQCSAAMLFTYDPTRSYLEITNPDPFGVGDLAISDCDPFSSLPLVRYLSGDRARIVPRSAMINAAHGGLQGCFDRLPLVALFGRQRDILAANLSVGDIKDDLYAELDTARTLTGAFRVRLSGERLRVDVQLKAAAFSPTPYLEALENRLTDCGLKAEINLLPFSGFGFGGGIDYERKFPYYQGLG